MPSILQQEHFWTAVAFVIFLLLFGKLCVEQIKKYLAQQVTTIKDEVTSSTELLEKSTHNLKNKKLELSLLEGKLQTSEQKNKENIDSFSETFFENLSIKEQQLKERFNNYLTMEKQIAVAKLNNLLITESYSLSLGLLKTSLSKEQKNQLLNSSIANLPNQLSKINS